MINQTFGEIIKSTLARSSDLEQEAWLLSQRQATWLGNMPPVTKEHTTLLEAYQGFMVYYSLKPNFFPELNAAGLDTNSSVKSAMHHLQTMHDVYHVLGEYEISDDEEIRIQSFIMGQAPYIASRWLSESYSKLADGDERYKHLRDIKEAKLSAVDYARGKQSNLIMVSNFPMLWDVSVDEARQYFNIPKRDKSIKISVNTCGGFEGQYWSDK